MINIYNLFNNQDNILIRDMKVLNFVLFSFLYLFIFSIYKVSNNLIGSFSISEFNYGTSYTSLLHFGEMSIYTSLFSIIGSHLLYNFFVVSLPFFLLFYIIFYKENFIQTKSKLYLLIIFFVLFSIMIFIINFMIASFFILIFYFFLISYTFISLFKSVQEEKKLKNIFINKEVGINENQIKDFKLFIYISSTLIPIVFPIILYFLIKHTQLKKEIHYILSWQLSILIIYSVLHISYYLTNYSYWIFLALYLVLIYLFIFTNQIFRTKKIKFMLILIPIALWVYYLFINTYFSINAFILTLSMLIIYNNQSLKLPFTFKYLKNNSSFIVIVIALLILLLLFGFLVIDFNFRSGGYWT